MERGEEHSLRVLGYSQLLEEIGREAQSPGGLRRVLALRPFHSLDKIRASRGLYEDLLKLEESAFGLPSLAKEDLSQIFLHVQPSDAILDGLELRQCLSLLLVVWDLHGYLREPRVQELPFLQDATCDLECCDGLRQALQRSLDADGSLLDGASERLRELRRSKAAAERHLQRALEEMIHDSALEGVLRDRFVTQRNGRYVVPVRRDSQSNVPGLVHDVSSTGQTLFVEPTATLGLGNQVSTLSAEEREECRRILSALSDGVRRALPALRRDDEILEELDAAAAVARWGGKYSCVLPAFGGFLRLSQARHPLLEAQFNREGAGRKVVPLDLQLPPGTRTLAITGSNTGGKTVALKTVGLLCLAAQTGLPVPVEQESLFPVFTRILADIGDEQSLDDNLSTFSGHLAQIADILRETAAPGESLVLLDELGSGTDPAEGGAIACAVLQELSRRQALTFATTHLGSVKNFVHATPGMVNGAVRFNLEDLQPEYVLELGRPGASHALSIAKRMGIPQNVLQSAEGFLSGAEVRLEKLLARLENEQRRAAKERKAAQQSRQEAEELLAKNREQSAELRTTRKKRIHDAVQEAQALLDNTRRQVENLLRGIREAGRKNSAAGQDAVGEQAAKARQWLSQQQDRLETTRKQTAPKPDARQLPQKEWTVGRRIWVEKLSAHGRILQVDEKHGTLEVEVNGLPFHMKCPEVFPEHAPEEKPPAVTVRAPVFQGQTSHELMLVGMRVDDALRRLEQYLNDCALAHLGEVRIVHGFGTGRLREAIHQFLKGHPVVQEFYLGSNPLEGGSGVTFVRLVAF